MSYDPNQKPTYDKNKQQQPYDKSKQPTSPQSTYNPQNKGGNPGGGFGGGRTDTTKK